MKKIVFTLMATLMFITSCSSFRLEKSQIFNNANLSDYKTFMVQPAESSSLPDGWTIVDAQNLVKVIVDKLQMRGYKLVTSNPSMIIYLAGSQKEVVETKDAIPPGMGFGYRYFGPRAAYAHNYYSDAQIVSDIRTEGLLMMDVVDVKQNVHIYFAEVINSNPDCIKELDKLNEAVDLLLRDVPQAK